ncbi:hypothetical protein [Nonomuraea recticatena]|uniref:DUF5753 domain-containing protein n=1 Tax=Nonomuraea recticatena TaxID=46178 RepID=A0ABP6E187_9ACTN
MNIVTPDHVHWIGRPAERFALLYVKPAAATARIESTAGVYLPHLRDLEVCRLGACSAQTSDVISEARALEEMLGELEDDGDPESAALRDELAARLAFVSAPAS